MTTEPYIDIVFDGPPGAEFGRFVEVENEQGQSIQVGEWVGPGGERDFWRLRIPTDRGLNSLALLIHTISTEKGFAPPSLDNLPEKLMLAVSELSEALEEHREGRPLVWYKTTAKFPPGTDVVYSSDGIVEVDGTQISMDDLAERHPEWADRRPEGILVEVADAVIRCLHIMHSLIENENLNPDGPSSLTPFGVVKEKIEYNAGRPAMHGKAY